MSSREKIELPEGVLKIKKGYNPNSSSIGTAVYSFPAIFMAVNYLVSILIFFVHGKKDD